MDHVTFAAVAASCVFILAAVAAGHLALTFRRRWLTACAERDAARADARHSHLTSLAHQAALSLAEAHACALCRAGFHLPDIATRRIPQHPS